MFKIKFSISFLALFIVISCSSDSNEIIDDTTPPELNISIAGLGEINDEPIVVSTKITLNIEAQDASGLQKVEAFIDNEKVGEDLNFPFQIIIDLSGYTSKSESGKTQFQNYTLKVIATDKIGNESTIEKILTIENLTRLITINIPDGFYDNSVDRVYVFASDTQGKLLANERITPESQEVVLSTSKDVTDSFEFMITFAFYRSNQVNTVTDFVTVANISNLEEINLQIPLRTNTYDAKYLPAAGFDLFDLYNTWGSSPFGSGQLQEANQVKNSEFRLLRRVDLGPEGLSTEKIYVALENLTLATYKYVIFDWNLDGITEVREDMFTNQGIERRRYESELSNENHQSTSLLQYGYFNDYEYENNIYHYDRGNGYQIGHPTDRFFYYYNTIFHKRRYDLTINNYFISAVGSPETYYPKTDLDFNHTFTNNELHFQSEGSDHIAGAVTLIDLDDSTINMVNGKEVIYGWNVVFDSQSQDPIKLPELPEELQDWEFYSFYEQNDLKLEQIEVRKYQTISSYAEYLEKVIKPNKHWYLASPKREVVFKRPISEHKYSRSNWYNFLID